MKDALEVWLIWVQPWKYQNHNNGITYTHTPVSASDALKKDFVFWYVDNCCGDSDGDGDGDGMMLFSANLRA